MARRRCTEVGKPKLPGEHAPVGETVLRLMRLQQAGMTQADLARRFGYSKSWISTLLTMVPSSSQPQLSV